MKILLKNSQLYLKELEWIGRLEDTGMLYPLQDGVLQ